MKRKLSILLVLLVVIGLMASTTAVFASEASSVAAGGTAQPNPTGNKANKTALALAKRFAVSYEEIMGWNARGYNFLDIKYAYTIRAATRNAVTVQAIFNLKAQGLSWSQIAKRHNVSLGGK